MRGVAVSDGFRPFAAASILTIVAVSSPRGASVPPTPIAQRRLPTTISLSKLHHAAHILAVYASQPSFPLSRSYRHARLASGWWPTFTGRGSRPRKVPNEVSVSTTATSSSSKLSQRKQRPSSAASGDDARTVRDCHGARPPQTRVAGFPTVTRVRVSSHTLQCLTERVTDSLRQPSCASRPQRSRRNDA